MAAAGVSDFNDRGGLPFGHSSLAIEAALDAQGVVLGETSLVADDLAAGGLVQPFAVSFRVRRAFPLLLSPEKRTTKLVPLFREWVVRGSGGDRAQPLDDRNTTRTTAPGRTGKPREPSP